MNSFKKYKAFNNKYSGIIEEDVPEFGWMLYIYENNIGIFDYNQDTMEICKEQAFEEFGILLDSWEEVLE